MKSFWPILKFSPTFCNSVDDSNFPEHPGAILEMLVERTSRFPPNRPFKTLHSVAEAGQAHHTRSEAANVKIGLGVQGESGRATFHLAEMTVESLIFIEQQLWYATKMFQESWGCFICSKSWQGQMPTRIFILWTSISAVGWHFIIIIVFLTAKNLMPDFWRSWNLATLYLRLCFWVRLARFIYTYVFVFFNLLIHQNVTSLISLFWWQWASVAWGDIPAVPRAVSSTFIKSSLPAALGL